MPEIAKHQEGRFSYSDLQTTDEKAAVDFYTKLFDWTVDEQPIGASDQIYYMFQKNGKTVGAASAQPEQQREMGVPPMWTTYFTVDDVDLKAKEVEQAGGTVHAQPFDVLEAGRMAVVADPAGGYFALWQPKANIGSEVMFEPDTLSWTEMHSTDPEKARRFYLDLFGWTYEEFDTGQGQMYTIFKSGDDQICGLFRQTTPAMPSYWLIYFDVDDTQEKTEKARSLGATIMVEPTPIPGVGTFSIIGDRQGAAFGIIKNETGE